jgi:hypothetical protein
VIPGSQSPSISFLKNLTTASPKQQTKKAWGNRSSPAVDPKYKRFVQMHTHAKLPETAIRFKMTQAGLSESEMDEFFQQVAQQ